MVPGRTTLAVRSVVTQPLLCLNVLTASLCYQCMNTCFGMRLSSVEPTDTECWTPLDPILRT